MVALSQNCKRVETLIFFRFASAFMYQYTPDEIDRSRAHHQAKLQGADDIDKKRIGNLGEFAFEQFCREYLPAEMWEWENEDAMRRCNP